MQQLKWYEGADNRGSLGRDTDYRVRVGSKREVSREGGNGAEVGRERVLWDDLTLTINSKKLVYFKFKYKFLYTK